MPEDEFGRRDPSTLAPADYDRWYCTPYISSIALQIKQVLPGADVRVIRRVAEGEGAILTRVRTLLWLVTFASLLAAALAVGASSAASVIERRTEIGLMKALGAGSGTVGFLLVAEQLLLALAGGGLGLRAGHSAGSSGGPENFWRSAGVFTCCTCCDYRPRRDRHATRERDTLAASLAL